LPSGREAAWSTGVALVTTISWTYDALGRLVTELYDSHDNSLDFTTDYVYDLVGNRLSKTTDLLNDSTIDETITYSFDMNDRMLVETKDVLTGVDTTTTYSYTGTEQTGKVITDTATGDLIQTVSYSFNLQGRMSEVIIESYDTSNVVKRETTTYEYNTEGVRVSSTNKVEVDDDFSVYGLSIINLRFYGDTVF
jgi:hypothetical protein